MRKKYSYQNKRTQKYNWDNHKKTSFGYNLLILPIFALFQLFFMVLMAILGGFTFRNIRKNSHRRNRYRRWR